MRKRGETKMERLTKRSANGRAYFPNCFSKSCAYIDLDICVKSCVFMERVCEKLAEYEDKDEQEKEITALSRYH